MMTKLMMEVKYILFYSELMHTSFTNIYNDVLDSISMISATQVYIYINCNRNVC